MQGTCDTSVTGLSLVGYTKPFASLPNSYTHPPPHTHTHTHTHTQPNPTHPTMRASTDESGGSLESEHGVRGTDCGSLCAFTPRENRGSCAGQYLQIGLWTCPSTRRTHGLSVHTAQARPRDEAKKREATPPNIAAARELFRKGHQELEAYHPNERWFYERRVAEGFSAPYRQERLRLLTAGGARQGGCCPSNAHVSTVVSLLPHLRTLQHGFRKYTPPPHTHALASVLPPPSSFPPLHTPTPSHTRTQ